MWNIYRLKNFFKKWPVGQVITKKGCSTNAFLWKMLWIPETQCCKRAIKLSYFPIHRTGQLSSKWKNFWEIEFIWKRDFAFEGKILKIKINSRLFFSNQLIVFCINKYFECVVKGLSQKRCQKSRNLRNLNYLKIIRCQISYDRIDSSYIESNAKLFYISTTLCNKLSK